MIDSQLFLSAQPHSPESINSFWSTDAWASGNKDWVEEFWVFEAG
jgi:hypothetical protein